VWVDCALDVVETREHERGDRLVGLARSQYDVVHRHPRYDARVDTATTGPEAAAAAILAALSW
jgi:chloramphenicol 3-O phosphotransferase